MAAQDPIKVDDPALLERVRRGDEAAFSTLYERHQRAIYRYAMHMCGPAAADDVVQDTFLSLFRQGRGFNAERGTVGAYLFGIARHHVMKQCGMRNAEYGSIEQFDEAHPRSAIRDPQSKSPLEDLERSEATTLVRAAIRTLPPTYREVVVLCELEEMDYADAAVVLECPIGTVRSRLHRGRALLTQKLASMRETINVER